MNTSVIRLLVASLLKRLWTLDRLVGWPWRATGVQPVVTE